MAEDEPTLVSRITGEYSHSPVSFVAAIFALLDILNRIYELVRGQLEAPRIVLPKIAPSLSPPAGQAALYLILLIFLALLGQNLVSFVWYKIATWLANLPILALIPSTSLLCGIVSLVTDYNMSILSENIAQLYQFNAQWPAQFIFVIGVLSSLPITLFIMISLVEEYSRAHHADIEWYGVLNLILYIPFALLLGFLLVPR